jgi:hypothetical protein
MSTATLELLTPETEKGRDYDERRNTIKASLLLIDAELRANREGRKDDRDLLNRVRRAVDKRTSEVSMNTGGNGGQYYVPSRIMRVRR